MTAAQALERQVERNNTGTYGRLADRITDRESQKRAVAYLMGAVRICLYRTYAEPSRGDAGRDATVLYQLLRASPPDHVLQAIIGAAVLRNAGKLRPMAEPREPMTARVLHATWGNRPLFQLAREAYLREYQRRPARGVLADAARKAMKVDEGFKRLKVS